MTCAFAATLMGSWLAGANAAEPTDAAGAPAKAKGGTAAAANPKEPTKLAPKTSTKEGKDAKDTDKPRSLFDGKSLGDWKESGFATQGRVEVKDGNLVVGFGEGCSGITYKGKFPTTNYELLVEAKRVDGSDFFCGLTFPVARAARKGEKAETQPCTLVVGGWGGGVVGLSSIDGHDASENSTSKFRDFESDKWYKIRLRVTEAKIEAWIDDEKQVDFTLGDKKLTVRIEVEESKPLGIATWRTTGAFRKIEVKQVDKPDSPAEKE